MQASAPPTYIHSELSSHLIDIDREKETITQYKGSLSYSQSRNRFVVQLKNKKQGIHTSQKTFSANSNPNALRDAVKFLRNLSDQHQLTTTRPATYVELQKQIPASDIEYISAMFDGDGSVGVYKTRLRVAFYQSSNTGIPDVLLFIQKRFGGRLHSSKRRKSHKIEHSLKFTGERSQALLTHLGAHSILKRDQILEAVKFCELIHVKDTSKQRDEIAQKLKSLKQQDVLKEVDISVDKLTPAYMAGIFDAEGCIQLTSGSIRLQITQFNCPRFLEALVNKYQCGDIQEQGQFRVYAVHAFRIIEQLLPFSIVKKEQLKEAITYYNINHKRDGQLKKHFLTDLQRDQQQELERRVKKMKRD